MMGDAIVQLVEGAVSSPWFYLALFAFAAIDGFFPLVPSESLVITAGVFAAGGEPDLVPVVVTAAAGAFAGDHVSFLAGRTVGGRAFDRTRPGTRRRAALEWAARTLASRGGLILVVSRYIPGGRTAVTLGAGAVGYPLRSFTVFDSLAAVSWALYAALTGYIGGAAFEDDPLEGLLLGFALAASVALLVELTRALRRRTRRDLSTVADTAAGR